MNNYYVYFHKNPITKEIFYVGIGNKKRAWNFKNRNIHWLRYVGKYGKPIIEIIKNNLNKKEACQLEMKYIQLLGRKGYDKNGILVNVSLGGEYGANGYKWSEERKRKYSERVKEWMLQNKESWKEKQKLGLEKRNIDYSFHKKGIKGKPIKQFDLKNNYINTFPSAKYIKDNLKISIDEALAGRAKTAGGYIWEYEKKIK